MQDVYSLFSDARKAAESGNAEKAKQLYQKLIDAYPDSDEAKVSRRELSLVEDGTSSKEDIESEDKYVTAHGLCALVSGLGWIAVAVAILFGVIAADNAPRGTTFIVVGWMVSSVIGGLLMVILGQATRAIIDMANNVSGIYAEIKKSSG